MGQAVDRFAELAATLRVLADPARLRLLGALAERPLTGTELAERLRLTPPTISHHTARLVAAGIVSATPDGARRRYALDERALRGLARSAAPPAEAAPATDADRDRAKVLQTFFDGPRLRSIPAQRRKRVIVLQHLLRRFAPGKDYPEREVNDRLREAHGDVATLRRELVNYGLMTRAAGVYRVAETLPARDATVAQEITGDEHAWLRDLIANAAARTLPPTQAEAR